MNKILLKYSTLLIFVILLSGFVLISITSYFVYGEVKKKDVERISHLASSNIYSEIDNEVTKPVVISQTMASGAFLIEWLMSEEDDEKHANEMKVYLSEYKRKYGYDSFSMVSLKTGNYYHHDGLHKKISRNDPHDVWFYNFIDSKAPYSVNVDLDEVNENVLTVFADSRVESSDGTLLGVIGVGLKITYLQNILQNYDNKFKIEAFIVDANGVIKIHKDDKLVKRAKASEIYANFNIKLNKDEPQKWWFDNKGVETFAVASYLPTIDAYLVVMDDTELFQSSFKTQTLWGLAIICAIAAILTISSVYISNHYKKLMTELNTTDELTSLSNRRNFSGILEKIIKKHPEGRSFLFVFDIDNFKSINDIYGHVAGDDVLKTVGKVCINVLGSGRNVFRVGGDEFCGIIHNNVEDVKEILEKLRREIEIELEKYKISISLGITRIFADDTIESVTVRADEAMYKSKNEGKNRLTFLDKGEA